MLYFLNDYSEGAHEKVLQHLIDTNMEQLPGYGTDHYCEEAKEKIKKACGCEDAEVFLLTGGTQTNQIVIDTMLQPYEGVVASSCGHVNTHEAGAIESTGHKVLTVPHKNGKLDADDLREYVQTFYADASHDHMVFPGMVYISHPSEYGTLYTKNELERLSAVCREFDMPLFLDGARLGYGLMSPKCDITLPELSQLCDVFYIGGTKVGALFGEAAVFTKHNMPRYFSTIAKQHGALLAKGRLLGLQFDTLFTDDLYFRISKPSTWPCRSAMPSMRVACSSIFIRRRTYSSSSWRTRPSVPCSRRLPSTPGARSTRSTALPASPRAGPQRRRMSTR